jgi:SAM-dependent methyltransferase
MLAHIGKALTAANIDVAGETVVLDIGCGSGNATFALAELLPKSRIIASDLSPQLLEIVAVRAKALGLTDRISILVADASEIPLRPGSFDLICGSSMLHHLVNPETTAKKYLAALKPSGSAMFFEPFHSGVFVLRQVMAALINMSRHCSPALDDKIAKTLGDFIFGIDYVTDESRNPLDKAGLDDKWLFTKSLFNRIGEAARRPVTIYPTSPSDEEFKKKIEALLGSLGLKPDWPEWALDLMRDMNTGRTADLRSDLLTEGAIIFGPR